MKTICMIDYLSLNCSLILCQPLAVQHGGKTLVGSFGRTCDLSSQPRIWPSQMKACMNHQIYDTGLNDLMQSQQRCIKVDPSEIKLYYKKNHLVFLLPRYSHFASFRKRVAWLLWVAWCLTNAGLACEGDVAALCQPASQPGLSSPHRAATVWWRLGIWHRTVSYLYSPSWKCFFLSWTITNAMKFAKQDKDMCQYY